MSAYSIIVLGVAWDSFRSLPDTDISSSWLQRELLTILCEPIAQVILKVYYCFLTIEYKGTHFQSINFASKVALLNFNVNYYENTPQDTAKTYFNKRISWEYYRILKKLRS